MTGVQTCALPILDVRRHRVATAGPQFGAAVRGDCPSIGSDGTVTVLLSLLDCRWSTTQTPSSSTESPPIFTQLFHPIAVSTARTNCLLGQPLTRCFVSSAPLGVYALSVTRSGFEVLFQRTDNSPCLESLRRLHLDLLRSLSSATSGHGNDKGGCPHHHGQIGV